MQEAIYDMGDIIIKNSSGIEPYLKRAKDKNKDKKLNVFKINFDINNKKIDFDFLEEISSKTSKKYLFVGRIGGPNNLQFSLSADKIETHISQSIYGLYLKLDEGELKNTLKDILEEFYIETEINNNRYKYILNIDKITGKNQIDKIISSSKDGKEIIKELKKEINEYLKQNKQVKLDNFGIFVIFINNQNIIQSKEYLDILFRNIVPQENIEKLKNEKKEEICSFCGKKGIMNWELKNFDIKYYTIDSWTFSSNMDKKNFNKTFILCSECEKKIIAGQKYMSEKLKTSLARMPLYMLPHFLLENPLDKEDLDNFSDKIQKSFKIIKNYESIKEAKKELEQIKYYYKDKKLYFTLDMLFYKKQQQSTKIIKTIKDIDPEIIFEIEDSIQKVQKEEVFSNDRFNISLESFVYNLPIKQKENSPTNYRYILEIYEKIFLKIKINKKKMIQNFLRLLGAIHFGNHEFIGSTENTKIAEKIKSQNKLLLFLENMNLFEKEDKMNIEELGIKDENIKKYINTVGYDEQKTALFLLGYLMGEIGKKEAKGNDENKKPILNKLNYKGSDFKKIQKLYVTVFGKLKQEKILKYYEKLHGIIGFLINKNENTWNLNASENEYYILSGFGYSSMWKEKVDKKDENIIQEVK